MPNLIDDLAAVGIDPKIAEEIAKNEKAAATLNQWREGGLRQSDYDRKMNMGKAELTAAQAKVAEQAAALEQERVRMNEEFLSAQRAREAADMLNAEVMARAKTASAVYGIDLQKELFGDHTPGSPAIKPPAPAASAGPSTDLEKRLKEVENLFEAVPNLTVELQDIALEHAKLFPDKPLILKEIMQKSVEQRRPPTKVWDDMFGATAKREEIVAEKYRKEGEERARAAIQLEQSKKAAAPFGIQTPASPIFAASANKSVPAPGDRAKGMADAIARASEALMSGKYAPGWDRRQQ